MTNEPPNPRQNRRIVLCMGVYCNQGGRAEPFYERLRQALGEITPAWASQQPIRWEIADCLSMCGAGPNLIVYPEETVYNHLDAETLERILHDLLEGGETGPQAK